MTQRPLRVAFLGTPDVAATVLDHLAADPRFQISLVVTNPDRPTGRGQSTGATAVKRMAAKHGLRVLQPERAHDVVDDLRAASVDVAAVVAYGSLLPAEVLASTRLGFVNLHYSLLPRWRGAAPVQHAIRAGDGETGVTAFVLDEGMDTGPILQTARTAIGPRESAGQLLARLTELGSPVLAEALVALASGAEPRSQPSEGATLAPKITAADVAIDWRQPADEIDRRCRSADPRPGAHTTFRDARIKVYGAQPWTGTGPAGQVIAVDEDGAIVACGVGAALITDVQPGGRARMSGRDFVNGQRPVVGEAFGTSW